MENEPTLINSNFSHEMAYRRVMILIGSQSESPTKTRLKVGLTDRTLTSTGLEFPQGNSLTPCPSKTLKLSMDLSSLL